LVQPNIPDFGSPGERDRETAWPQQAIDLLLYQGLASSCGNFDNAPLKCSDESHERSGLRNAA